MASKNIEIRVKDVRGSFLSLVTPQERRNDQKELTGYTFNGNFLIPKKLPDGTVNPQVAELANAMKEASEARWAGQNKKIPPERRCVRDGEPKDEEDGEPVALYDGYEGCFFLSANRNVSIDDWKVNKHNPVQLLGPKKGADGKFPRLSGAEAQKLFYSGAYFDIIVRIYGYDGKNENPDRINASLEAVKFKRHGEAFGAKPVDADNMFDDEPDDDLDDSDLGTGTASAKKKSGDDDDMLG